jgi:protein phosphatase
VLTAHCITHPGHVRKVNEDGWRADIAGGFFAVADGMGGHNCGEVAARVALDVITQFMQRTQVGEEVTWPYGIDPALSFDANRVLTAIKVANRRVFKESESRDEYNGMGTTVTAALITGDELIFANVGDSRLYSFADGCLTQLTVDDSWLTTLQAQNPSTAVHANHPMRHVLTNVVGARDLIDVKVTSRLLLNGEVLLLCSDGLHGELDHSEMAKALAEHADLAEAARYLVDAALQGPARDNITALLVRIAPEAGAENSS